MEKWRVPLLEVVCGSCGCVAHIRDLKTCARCRLTMYCSKECQAAAWPHHRRFCKEVVQQSTGSRSYVALAKNAARAMRCFEQLGVTLEDLHPMQRLRLDMLHEALDFVKLGQVPPEPRPPTCLNPECNKKPLLVEFGNERELREFVITGLCASCQAQAYANAVAHAGPVSRPSGPTPPANQLPFVYNGDGNWIQLFSGISLNTDTTVWEEGEEQRVPLWVAGEAREVVSLWEKLPSVKFLCTCDKEESEKELLRAVQARQPAAGDGEAVLSRKDGNKVTIPVRTLRAMLLSGSIYIGFTSSIPEMRGLISPPPTILDTQDMEAYPPPPLVCFLMFAHVKGQRMENVHTSGRLKPELVDRALYALLKIMTEDEKMRKEGTFESYWASKVPSRRYPAVSSTATAVSGGAGSSSG